MRAEVLKTRQLEIEGGTIPITLWRREDEEYEEVISFGVDVDGVEWFEIESEMHAIVLFTMMSEHLLEYMRYRAR